MYVKNALTLADAKQIAAAAEAEALKNNWRVTIAVLDDGGNLLFLQRLDEAPLGSIVVAQEKARTALLFKRPTKVFEEIIASGRTAMLTLPGATPIEGGLPLLNNGQLIGAIGVGGGNADEQCAYQALVKVLGPQPAIAQPTPATGAAPTQRPQ